MIDIINKHIKEHKGVHIKKAIEPFGWDIVVNHLQQCADGDYCGRPKDILSYELNEAEEIPEVKRVMDYLNKELDLKIFDAHIFTSFTKKVKGALHADNHNVLVWSISGNMMIHLYDPQDDEPFYSAELNKGDMVFIPADLPHKIEALGARALVSYGIEVAEGVKFNSEITNPYVKVQKENND
jgi:mannose-6-phosphate isomerase-like protein (cupin superfamily)